MELLVYIFERRRYCYTFACRKSQSMCLSFAMIGVLSQNDNLYIIIICKLHCIKNFMHRRIYSFCAVFGFQKFTKFQVVLLGKFSIQNFVPSVSEFDHKKSILCLLSCICLCSQGFVKNFLSYSKTLRSYLQKLIICKKFYAVFERHYNRRHKPQCIIRT